MEQNKLDPQKIFQPKIESGDKIPDAKSLRDGTHYVHIDKKNNKRILYIFVNGERLKFSAESFEKV